MVGSTGFITGCGGLRLFYRVWRPEQATRPEQPVRSMILVHGMNEHSGRYVHVADYFTDQVEWISRLDQKKEGVAMPVIRVEMWEGRSDEQKRDLIKSLTTETVKVLGCPKEAVTVVLYDVSKKNWGVAGESCENRPG